MNVVLVDDEELSLEGLQRIVPWQELGLHVQAAVKNGREALEWMRQQPVDILVSDIRMPHMSGLELAEQAKRIVPGLQVIFISGYEDFRYAKRAIEMEAGGYVLKPINYKELSEALQRAKAKIREERAALEAVQAQVPLKPSEILFHWLEGTDGPEKVAELLGELAHACVYVFEIDDVSWKLVDYTEEERERLLTEMLQLVEQSISEQQWGYGFACGNYRYALISPLERSALEQRMLAFLDKVRAQFPLSISIGVGSSSDAQEPEALKRSYRQAKEALSLKMFLGKGRLLDKSVARQEVVQQARELDQILDELTAAMSTYDLVGIDDWVTELTAMAARMKNELSVRNFMILVITRIDLFLRTLHENFRSLLGYDISGMEIIHRFETIHDMRSWLRRRMYEISELLHLKKNRRKALLAGELEEYLMARLGQPNVTLKDLGQHVGFSPNYLSTIFKEEFGVTFSDFMLRKRMERARELMADPKLRVYEIADRVGYRNRTFFNRQFREFYGLSPTDFRKQMGGRREEDSEL